ncbi:hypothetical protein POL68_04455 [Stigmatella sp. ncwal1]|uniref:RING-type E3 ubiquitin transferase n=2 Tax=Stigmatella ashevillensis TaxID=2995309 RepID=A0ABT5D219_9BACT|nr:hypothetical protein [Stigmatella ashevillena]
MLLAPMYATALSALVVAAFAFGRKDAHAFTPRWPLVGFGLLATVSLLWIADAVPLAVFLSGDALSRGLGFVLVGLAAALALWGSRARLRADTLRSTAPQSLDDAIEALRAGRAPGWGVYRGRLGASDQVTSPSGVVCAFYEAELRSVGDQGRKGSLISQDRGHALVITLRGERSEAAVSYAPSTTMAPVRVLRCQTNPRLVEPEAGELAEGQPVEEVLSYERVGKLGETCLVVGQLQRGPAPGSYVLRGQQGGPAMMVLGNETLGSGHALARRAWSCFAAAGALSVAAAFVLSRTL